MGLPWVRLDSDINQNDKVVLLIKQPQGWRAFGVYIFGMAWCGAHASDGLIPKHMLEDLKGQHRHAELLVDHGLWTYDPDGRGWLIKNWDQRQELTIVAEAKNAATQLASKKANCVRWHGKDCGCWRESA